MIKKLQKKYALSEQGAKDLIKGCLACVLQNLSFMFPVGLLYYLVSDLMNGGVPGGKIPFYVAASAILQSVKSRPMEIRIVEMIEPASSGIKCEKLCSRKVQSAIMVLVRSAKSFFPKKERGILRRCSARVIRRMPLSL